MIEILHTCGCRFPRNWTRSPTTVILCKKNPEHQAVMPMGALLMVGALGEFFIECSNGGTWRQVKEWNEEGPRRT